MHTWKMHLYTALLRGLQKPLSRFSPFHIEPPSADTADISYLLETTAGFTLVYIYYPQKDLHTSLPVFVNLHGGGFFMGQAEDDEKWGKYIAAETPCVVVNVDYHLAPKTQFPDSLFEIRDVLLWLHEHNSTLGLDMGSYSLGGHSAGGNLAAATVLLLRDTGLPLPRVQILDSPILDLHTNPRCKPAVSGAIPAAVADLFAASYLKDSQDRRHPYISPLYAKSLEELPPALLFTPEFDSLALEANDYAARLRKAGTPASFHTFPGTFHAFTHNGKKESAYEAWNLIIKTLRLHLLSSISENK
ncbi:alpha/beta hydrolase [Sinobaca sp. H24]|uniref:alpha/beta hydrolase n=1 Tax=Sinobaca sp. H24 TaxID=2923376 RepID=UPI00207985DA|nr:alpha/beta hydrolase [Sinobaca sp. H24]